VTGSLDLPEADLPIPPYVLGVWLGDGHSYGTQITAHRSDLEIADHLRACGVEIAVEQKDRRFADVLCLTPSLPWPAHVCRRGHDMNVLGRYTKGQCAECARQAAMKWKHGRPRDAVRPGAVSFFRRLTAMGLIKSRKTPETGKHIPAIYLRASRDQRLALLQGLMDTDGHVGRKGRCELVTIYPRLADGFGELLATLGIKFTSAERQPMAVIDGERRPGKPARRFSFMIYDDTPVVRLSRKRARQVSREGRRTTETERRRIVAVEPVPSVPVKCIQVDSPNRLYLAGRAMIPTHNTEMLNNAIGYHIDQDPAPIMVVMPTERDAETWSKDRFSPMARDTPCLTGKIADPRSRDGNNKILHKRFPGGHLTIVGANAPSGLASRPIRLLLCDEVDRYPFSAGAEGDPVNLARKRTVTFWNRKIVLVSTPTNRGASRIEAAWEESDQRQFHLPCPDCGAEQVLTWGQVRWDKDPDGTHRPETARYHCVDCDAGWRDETRWAAVSRGRWIANRPFAGIAGFHLNEIYSPWVRLEAMVRAFLSARAGGDQAMKTFVNTSLGETWVESGEAPDWQRLADRREAWPPGTVPAGGLFLTAGADVQKDRIEVDVWAWGRGLQSWLVDHLVLEGGPGDPACWQQLTNMLGRTWAHACGAHMTLARLAIDTGFETSAVYAWSRQVGFAQVAPVKGVEGFNRASPVTGPTYVDATIAGKRLRRGARLWTVATSTFKAETYRFLRQGEAEPSPRWGGESPPNADAAICPPGTIHLPDWADGEWLKQLTAEQLVTVRTKRGFARLEWQKLRERNEALDTRVPGPAPWCSAVGDCADPPDRRVRRASPIEPGWHRGSARCRRCGLRRRGLRGRGRCRGGGLRAPGRCRCAGDLLGRTQVRGRRRWLRRAPCRCRGLPARRLRARGLARRGVDGVWRDGFAAHDRGMARVVGQNDVGDPILVAVLRVGGGLHHDAGGKDDAFQMAQPRQNPLGLGRGALVPGIKAEGAVDHRPKRRFRDLPADGLAFLVELAARHGEALPELAPRMGPLDHGELAIEHPGIAGLRRLQQARIHRGRAIHAAGADGQPHLGEGAVRDQFADGGHLRLGVVQIVAHVMCPFRDQEANAG
jgi:phage terminase large subunit GpA-like protein